MRHMGCGMGKFIMYNNRWLSGEALLFGGFLFFVYMLAKAPLLLAGEMDGIQLIGSLLLMLMLMSIAILLLVLCRKIYACYFLTSFNLLFLFNLMFGAFNDFGFLKYVSLSFLLSVTAIVYCILPKRKSLGSVLLNFAGLLVFYGCLAVLWGVAKGQQFVLREPIGVNGPIVFGQLMVIASAILLLYGNRKLILASLPAALSLLSYSKGPILAGMFILFLKKRMFFMMLIVLSVPLLLVLPGELLDNRVFRFFGSLYESLRSSDFGMLFEGANYGSIGARLEQYLLAINLLSDYPLGIGIGQWALFSEYEYPHNYLVEILIEQGLVLGMGSLLMIAFFFTKIRDRNLVYLLLMLFLFSMFSGSVVDNRGIYLMVLLGMLYREGSSPEQKEMEVRHLGSDSKSLC